MTCILNCCKTLYSILNFASKSGFPSGADEFLPLLIYVVIKANPQRFQSNIDYIQNFRKPNKLITESGYYLTNYVAAVSFVESIDASSLKISPEEFERYMNENASKQLTSSVPPVDKPETQNSFQFLKSWFQKPPPTPKASSDEIQILESTDVPSTASNPATSSTNSEEPPPTPSSSLLSISNLSSFIGPLVQPLSTLVSYDSVALSPRPGVPPSSTTDPEQVPSTPSTASIPTFVLPPTPTTDLNTSSQSLTSLVKNLNANQQNTLPPPTRNRRISKINKSSEPGTPSHFLSDSESDSSALDAFAVDIDAGDVDGEYYTKYKREGDLNYFMNCSDPSDLKIGDVGLLLSLFKQVVTENQQMKVQLLEKNLKK